MQTRGGIEILRSQPLRTSRSCDRVPAVSRAQKETCEVSGIAHFVATMVCQRKPPVPGVRHCLNRPLVAILVLDQCAQAKLHRSSTPDPLLGSIVSSFVYLLLYKLYAPQSVQHALAVWSIIPVLVPSIYLRRSCPDAVCTRSAPPCCFQSPT